MYDFLASLAPHLTRRLVDRAASCKTPQEVEELFADIPIFQR
jgi:LysR family cys regulon transcriptional activator